MLTAMTRRVIIFTTHCVIRKTYEPKRFNLTKPNNSELNGSSGGEIVATKTNKSSESESQGGKEERRPIFELARKMLLASVGAMALAQDEAEDFVNRLVERGEIAEKDGRKLVKEMMDRRKKESQKAEDEVSKRVQETLERLNVPTKADIAALSDKIATLTKKVEDLKNTQG
jgi:poly(hydroxyalkanoate) granule-associated protein